jgi:hypothetical protein
MAVMEDCALRADRSTAWDAAPGRVRNEHVFLLANSVWQAMRKIVAAVEHDHLVGGVRHYIELVFVVRMVSLRT